MKVNVLFDNGVDVIEFEPFLGDDIEVYREAIEKYFYDEIIDEDGCIELRFKKSLGYTYFGLEQLIDWMKKVALNCNVRIVSRGIKEGKEDKRLPYLCF